MDHTLRSAQALVASFLILSLGFPGSAAVRPGLRRETLRGEAVLEAAGAEEADEGAVREVLAWMQSGSKKDRTAAVRRLEEWLIRPIEEETWPSESEFVFSSNYSDTILLFRRFTEGISASLPKIRQGYRNLALLDQLAREKGRRLLTLSRSYNSALARWTKTSATYFTMVQMVSELSPTLLEELRE